jgi:hypothetical protein
VSTAQRALASFGDGQTTASASYTVTIPATAKVGDIAVVSLNGNSSSVTLTLPANWTLRSGPDVTSTATESWLATKVLTTADIGTTVTFTFSASIRATGYMEIVSGGTITGIQVYKTVLSAAATNIAVPAMTGVPAGAYISLHVCRRTGSGPAPVIQVPSPYSTDGTIGTAWTSSANLSQLIAHEIAATTGSYGGETTTADSSTAGSLYAVVIPAAPTSKPTFITSAQAENQGTTTVVVTVPAGVTPDHLGVAAVATANASDGSTATMTGWTARDNNGHAVGMQTGSAYIFTRLGGQKTGDTLTFNLPSTEGATLTVAWYDSQGRDVAAVGALYDTNAADTGTVNFPAPTYTGTRDVLLVVASRTSGAPTLNTPAGAVIDYQHFITTQWNCGAVFGHASSVASQQFTAVWAASAVSHNVNALQLALEAAPATNAKIATLSDNYATKDTTKWSWGPLAANTGGQVVLTMNTAYDGWLLSNSVFDLTGSAAFVQVVSAPQQGDNVSATQETYFSVYDQSAGNPNNSSYNIHVVGTGANSLVAYTKNAAGTYVAVGSPVTYSPVTHKWWRIRESGGTVFFETSPDGFTWTAFASVSTATAGIPITALRAQMGAGYWGSITPSGRRSSTTSTSRRPRRGSTAPWYRPGRTARPRTPCPSPRRRRATCWSPSPTARSPRPRRPAGRCPRAARRSTPAPSTSGPRRPPPGSPASPPRTTARATRPST